MENERMTKLYQEIAEKLDDIIPSDWFRIYLYAEVIYKDSTLVYFYFSKTITDSEYYYYYDIPSIFNIDRSLLKVNMRELVKLLEEFNQEFKDSNPEVWTNLTLILESTGKFNISYSYEDVLSSEITNTERQWLFKYKHLGLLPDEERNRIFVEEYIRKQREQ